MILRLLSNRWLCTVVGITLVVLTLIVMLVWLILTQLPGKPIIYILDKKSTLSAIPVRSSLFQQKEWKHEPFDGIEIKGFWNDQEKAELEKQYDGEPIGIDETLIDFQIGPQAGNRVFLRGPLFAWGSLYDREKGYRIHLVEGVINESDYFLKYVPRFDETTRILVVWVGWKLATGECYLGKLRFQLTPDGFVFLGEDVSDPVQLPQEVIDESKS